MMQAYSFSRIISAKNYICVRSKILPVWWIDFKIMKFSKKEASLTFCFKSRPLLSDIHNSFGGACQLPAMMKIT